MSSEIKQQIDKYYAELEEAFSSGNFVLNKKVKEITEKIDELKKKCNHEYNEYGICIYCNNMKGGK